MLSKTSGTTSKVLKTYDAWYSQFVNVLPLVMTNDILPYYQTRTPQNIRAFIRVAVREDRAIYWFFWPPWPCRTRRRSKRRSSR